MTDVRSARPIDAVPNSQADPVRKSPAAKLKYTKKRERVLSAALELFGTNGYDATSLQQIADKSGLLKGSLYYYYHSKEELLIELIERVHTTFSAMLNDFEPAGAAPLEQIETLLRTAAVDAGRNQKILGVFYRELPRIEPERRARIIALRDRQDALMRQLVTEGQAAGEIDAGLDAKLTAIGLGALVNSIYSWYDPNGKMSLEQIANNLVRMAVNSLLPRP